MGQPDNITEEQAAAAVSLYAPAGKACSRVKAHIFGLTVPQPIAWCIAKKHQAIENRDWTPPEAMCPVGSWLAIHAGKKFDLDRALDIHERFNLEIPAALPSSAIVAVARFCGVVTAAQDPWFRGPFGWLLGDVVELPEPVPCRGFRKLWPLPLGVLEAVRGGWRVAKGLPANVDRNTDIQGR